MAATDNALAILKEDTRHFKTGLAVNPRGIQIIDLSFTGLLYFKPVLPRVAHPLKCEQQTRSRHFPRKAGWGVAKW